MQKPFATPLIGAASLRGAGTAIRTAQTIGLEWLDLGKQSFDDLVATAGRLAACRSASEVMTVQSALAQRMTERALARSVVLSDQVTALVGQMRRPAGPPREP